VGVLRLQVPLMDLGDIVNGDGAAEAVNIHVKQHGILLRSGL
jgi:hypothetical protein